MVDQAFGCLSLLRPMSILNLLLPIDLQTSEEVYDLLGGYSSHIILPNPGRWSLWQATVLICPKGNTFSFLSWPVFLRLISQSRDGAKVSCIEASIVADEVLRKTTEWRLCNKLETFLGKPSAILLPLVLVGSIRTIVLFVHIGKCECCQALTSIANSALYVNECTQRNSYIHKCLFNVMDQIVYDIDSGYDLSLSLDGLDSSI